MNADEKLHFRAHFRKLGQGRIIPVSDAGYWARFWQAPTRANDVYDTLAVEDVRAIRDHNLANFVTLIRVLLLRLCAAAADSTPHREVLNIVRMLTRALPLLFERANGETELFWSTAAIQLDSREEVLGARLVHAILSLLFWTGFTLDASARQLWEPGIGALNGTHKRCLPGLEAHRMEVLKLMLVVCTSGFYQRPAALAPDGDRFLTFLVLATPRLELLTLVCSLINAVCKASGQTPPQNASLREVRYSYVTCAAQLLCLMVAYPMPHEPHWQFLCDLGLVQRRPFNMARAYLAKLSSDSELQYLAAHLMQIVASPIKDARHAEESSFGGGVKLPPSWVTEALAFTWELLQCNKRFRSLIQTNELFVALVYHIYTYLQAPALHEFVRICNQILLYLSADITLTAHLCSGPIIPQYLEQLPTHFRPTISPTTMRDLVVFQICALLLKPPLAAPPESISMSLVDVLYNVIPVVSQSPLGVRDQPLKKLANCNPLGGIGYGTCNIIMQVIVKFSAKLYLLQSPHHADQLALILRAVCAAMIKHPKASRMLLLSTLKNERHYDALWNTVNSLKTEYFSGDKLMTSSDILTETTEAESEDSLPLSRTTPECDQSDKGGSLGSSMIDVGETLHDEGCDADLDAALQPSWPTGMSLKARAKLPRDAPLCRSWGGNDALRIILTVISPLLNRKMAEVPTLGASLDTFALVVHLEHLDFAQVLRADARHVNHDYLPDTAFEPMRFGWSHLALGWYMSMLYASMYKASDTVKAHARTDNKLIKNIASSLASITKLTQTWGLAAPQEHESNDNIEHAARALSTSGPWTGTHVTLFQIPLTQQGFFSALNAKFKLNVTAGNPHDESNGANPIATPRTANDNLTRRMSQYRLSNPSVNSLSSAHSVANGTPIEEHEEYFAKRNSASSLHSVNLINRSHAGTPRTSISLQEE